MGLFKNLTTDGLEEATDTLGGYSPLESDIYIGTVKALYAGQSTGGATSVTLIADLNGTEYRETIYVTSRKGENFYTNQAGKKLPLPGFTTVNDICLITTEAPLSEQDTEDKIIKAYSLDAGGEINQSVPMLMGAIGQPIALAIMKNLELKQVKDDTGTYVDTDETVERNEIVKVFHPEYKVTIAEAQAGREASFWDSWLKRNQGKPRDRTKGKTRTSETNTGTTKTAPKKSLFGNK